MSKELDRLRQERNKVERQLRKAQNDEKALAHDLTRLTRAGRTHRLCTRGGMLESFLTRLEVLTGDDVIEILKQAFSQTDMKEIVAESVKGRAGGKPLTE